MFTLDRLSMRELAAMCSGVTRCTQGAATMEEAAGLVARWMRDEFGRHSAGRHDVALSRVFQTVGFERLPHQLQSFARDKQDPLDPPPDRCLVLTGTDGDLPEWCDRTRSAGHQAIPLTSVTALARLPMVAALVQELGISVSSFVHGSSDADRVEDFGVLHVAEALGCDKVPDQVFVREQEIASVVGFGGVLPGGDVFSVILFSRAHIAPAVAHQFRTLAVAVKLALLPFAAAPLLAGMDPAPVPADEVSAAHIHALEQMLDVQQQTVSEQTEHLERALEEATREAAANDVLRRITTTLSAELEVGRVVQSATDAVTEITEAAFGAFFYNVVENGEKYLLHALSGAEKESFAHFPAPRITEVFRPTFEGEAIVRSADVTSEPAYGHNPPYRGMPKSHPPVRSYLAVPVQSSSGEVLGGFLLGHPEPDRFDRRHERLAVGIAAQTAIALDNARLYQAERETALALQRSLLPQRVSGPEGLEVGAIYLGGGTGTDVGGDWYDVIPLAGGRTAVVIGDVMGKGVRAAAVMGQLRTAIRAHAVSDLRPQTLMERLNRLVVDMDEELIATCIYAVVDQNVGTVTLTSAGHLLPAFVSPERSVSLLEGEVGPPLGIDGAVHSEHRIAFPVGWRMLLYTDGLVEDRSQDLDTGQGLLLAELARRTGPCEAVCQQVLDALVGSPGHDDITLMLIGHEARTRSESVSQVFAPTPSEARQARNFLTAALEDWGDGELGFAVTSAFNELFINAITHAGTEITVRLRRLPRTILVEVEDLDAREPRRTVASADDEHYRGLQIVDTFSERWGFRPTETGKVVWAEFAADAGSLLDD